MRVVFISPSYPPEQISFTRGLKEVGAEVIGVADVPLSGIPEEVRHNLAAYEQVRGLFDEEHGARAIAEAVAKYKPDRLETNWEPVVLAAARARELLSIPGMSRDVCLGFRDKGVMKERLARAGVRVPHNLRIRTAAEAWAAVERIGYPICLKPIAGAGSADTFRCDDKADMEHALKMTQHVQEASVEEFVEGEEFTYDTVCIDGKPAFENVAQYFPRPLEFRSKEWISPAQIVFRDPYRADLQGGVTMGRKVLDVLQMGTGFTHMEWYRKRDGEVVFGEIGCRNGGGHFVDMMNWSNDFDVYREWARSVCWKHFAAEPARKYHVGMVFKRAQGRGRITRIEGLERVEALCGTGFVGETLSRPGTPRRDWKQTLISDGWVAVRHPDLAQCRRMVDLAVGGIRMWAE